ncbi:MAG: hypothetical protein ACRDRR_17020 [Pseudonocardiaceae bacterium]
MTIKWGLSVLDWCNHAIDDRADHPLGIYRALCGHRLMMITALQDDKPLGSRCEVCVATQCAESESREFGTARRANPDDPPADVTDAPSPQTPAAAGFETMGAPPATLPRTPGGGRSQAPGPGSAR